MKTSMSRRRVLLTGAIATTAALVSRQLLAADANLSPEDPQAKALGYVEDAAKVDTAKWPKKAADQHCANCALYQGGEGAAYGPCSIFPGKQVAAAGWCNVWAPKA